MSDEKFLSFEDPIKELAQKLSALRTASVDSPALNTEIQSLEKENRALTKKIYSKLDTWQIVQVARHPNRPHTSDYIKRIFDDFDELHGDRQFGDDASIIGGIGLLENMPVMVIGHEKGRDTDEKLKRNFVNEDLDGNCVEDIYNEYVNDDGDTITERDICGFSYDNLHAISIKAIQELLSEVELLKNRIQVLESLIS